MNRLSSPIFIAVVLLYSCIMSVTANNRNHSTAARFHFDITDRPDEKRFVLSLKSLDDRPLCIYVEKWPNQKGQLHFGSRWVKLKSPNGTYPAKDENFGYCVDEHGKHCLIYIAPRSTLNGFIGYEQFGNPAVIEKLSRRQLDFPVSPSVCEK